MKNYQIIFCDLDGTLTISGATFPKGIWDCDLFSYIKTGSADFCVCVGGSFEYCIPYNDDTKHLAGRTDEAPEFYRYWED